MTYYITNSTRKNKKFMVMTVDYRGDRYNTIHFGAFGYGDHTTHHDDSKKNAYIARHSVNENWTSTGIDTPGFWSRWILWNHTSIFDSIKDTENRFNITIKYIDSSGRVLN